MKKIVYILSAMLISSVFLGLIPEVDAAVSDNKTFNVTPASRTEHVSGTINSDTIWVAANSPYIVDDDLTIAPGIKLTIEPGVVVKVNVFSGIEVEGILIAEGTATNPITFTSNYGSPLAGDWNSLKFSNTSNDNQCIINYCIIEYATYGIYCDEASPTITNTVINKIMKRGIYCENAANPTITNNKIMNVTWLGASNKGIDCFESNPTISNNLIYNCTHYGIKLLNSSPTITSNVIKKSVNGIHCAQESSPTISGNTLDDNSNGIFCQSDSIPEITGNTITNTEHYGIFIDGAPPNIYETNTISNSKYGITVNDINDSIVNIEDVDISNCMYGMDFKNVSWATVTNCSIASTEKWDFELTKWTNLTTINTTFSKGISISADSKLVVKNFLEVKTIRKDGSHVSGTEVKVLDHDVLFYNSQTNNAGLCSWILIIERIYFGISIATENMTTIEVNHDSIEFTNNPRVVSMAISHTEVFIEPNKIPLVSITYPLDGDVVNGTVKINGTAFDPDDDVEFVEIQIDYENWNRAETDVNWETWEYRWNTSLYQNGAHMIRARAYDGADAAVVSINVIVNNTSNKPPILYISSHLDEQIVSGIIQIRGSAIDPDGYVQKVEIKIDDEDWVIAINVSANWSDWSYEWDTTTYENGEHTIAAKATDDFSAETVETIGILIKNEGNMPPILHITAPPDGDVVAYMVTIKGIAHDIDGYIVSVEVQIDGNGWENATDTNTTSDGDAWSTWSYDWGTMTYENGDHLITARATDNFSAETVKTIKVMVNNEGNRPPVLNITTPPDGDIVTDTVTIKGIAKNLDGYIVSVVVQIDGNAWEIATNTASNGDAWSTWSYNWDSKGVKDGEHEISVYAIDDNSTQKIVTIMVTVSNGAPSEEDNILEPLLETEYHVGFLLSIFILIIIIVIFILIKRKRGKEEKKKDKLKPEKTIVDVGKKKKAAVKKKKTVKKKKKPIPQQKKPIPQQKKPMPQKKKPMPQKKMPVPQEKVEKAEKPIGEDKVISKLS